MGNAFDKFDKGTKSSGNSFDQFDGSSSPDLIDPPRETLGHYLRTVARNAPGDAVRFGVGVLNAFRHPVQTFNSLNYLANGLTARVPGVGDLLTWGASEDDLDRARQASDAVLGAYGHKLQHPLATFRDHPVETLADVSPILGAAGGAARAGGLAGLAHGLETAATVTNPMSLPTRTLGAAGNLAGRGIGWGYNMAFIGPKRLTYLRAVEDRGIPVLNALRNPNQQIVPGSRPTAAEAASSARATRFAALGEESRQTLPSDYNDRLLQQNAARLDRVREVGQTPNDLTRARAIRGAVSTAKYRVADRVNITGDPELLQLMQRPSMDKVFARAEQLAAERAQPFQFGTTAPAHTVTSPVLGPNGAPITTHVPATYATYPGTSVHSIKQAFDDLIKNPERFGIGAKEVQAIGETKRKFLNWAERKNTAYKDARESHARLSVPINQMRVGQFVEKKLAPVLGEDTAALRANGYVSALEDAPRTIKNATTGEVRFDRLDQVLSPQQIRKLEEVRDDLVRSKITEQQAKAAKGSGPNPRRVGDDHLGDVRAPNILDVRVALANRVISMAQGRVNRRVAEEIAREMLEPRAVAPELATGLRRQAVRNALSDVAHTVGAGALDTIRFAPTYNALNSIRRDNQR